MSSKSSSSAIVLTPPQTPPALVEENESSASPASAIGSRFFSSGPGVRTGPLPMRTIAVNSPEPRRKAQSASPRTNNRKVINPVNSRTHSALPSPRRGRGKDQLSIKVTGANRSKSVTPRKAAALAQSKDCWSRAQGVKWQPRRTRRGSAPRALDVRKALSSVSPKTPERKSVRKDSSDLLQKFARGTNGPARITGEEGNAVNAKGPARGGFLDRNDELDDKYARNKRKPASAKAAGRFGFVNKRSSQRPGTGGRRSQQKTGRPNPQYERTTDRDTRMRNPCWRNDAPTNPAWE